MGLGETGRLSRRTENPSEGGWWLDKGSLQRREKCEGSGLSLSLFFRMEAMGFADGLDSCVRER